MFDPRKQRPVGPRARAPKKIHRVDCPLAIYGPPAMCGCHPSVVTPRDRTRLDAQVTKIVERLKQGPALNTELAAIALKYTSRISDARKLGFLISCTRVSGVGGQTMYTLKNV